MQLDASACKNPVVVPFNRHFAARHVLLSAKSVSFAGKNCFLSGILSCIPLFSYTFRLRSYKVKLPIFPGWEETHAYSRKPDNLKFGILTPVSFCFQAYRRIDLHIEHLFLLSITRRERLEPRPSVLVPETWHLTPVYPCFHTHSGLDRRFLRVHTFRKRMRPDGAH